MTDKIRDGFASALKRGENLPTEIVVEMLVGVLRDQEPVAWVHPSEGVLQRRGTGLEHSTYTIPLYAAPITTAAPPDKCAALLARFVVAVGRTNWWANPVLWKPLGDLADEARTLLSEREQAAQSVPKCATCGGHGMIGGPSYYAPDEGGVPCPDCAAPKPEGE